jgi:RNA polymerase sigma-70 factor (ECF subfamily)
MFRSLILVAGLCPLVTADEPKAAPAKDPAAEELAKLQGKWQLVANEQGGKVTKVRTARDGYIMSIEKDVVSEFTDEGRDLCTKDSMRIDPTKTPKTMDRTITFCKLFPSAKGTKIEAIYELKEDELKIAVPIPPFGTRPKGFTTKNGDLVVVATYKRIKK